MKFERTGILVAAMLMTASLAGLARAGTVYTADEKGGSISIIDVGTDQVTTVAIPLMPHNVQISADGARLYAVGMAMPRMKMAEGRMPGMRDADGKNGKGASGRLVIFSSANIGNGPIGEIVVGGHPAHVVTSADGTLAFVTDSEMNSVLVIDLATRRVIRRIGTDAYPHGLRLSPDGRELYVANVKGGTVSVIDTGKLTETTRIRLGKGPVQVAFTADGKIVLASLNSENKVAIIDRETRQVLIKLPVGRNPVQVYATPDSRYAYVANQGTEKNPDETVSVIDIRARQVVATVVTGKGAHGVVVSDDGKLAFISNIVDGTVSALDTATSTVIRSFKVGAGPNGITFRRDGQ